MQICLSSRFDYTKLNVLYVKMHRTASNKSMLNEIQENVTKKENNMQEKISTHLKTDTKLSDTNTDSQIH